MPAARHHSGGVSALMFCVALMVAGCATTASMRPDRTYGPLGIPRYYHHAKPEIFQVAQEAAGELGLTIIESVPAQSYFIAKRGMSVFGCGTLVGVYVQETVDHFTRVLIWTEPIFPAGLLTPEYSLPLHTLILHKLQTKQEATTGALPRSFTSSGLVEQRSGLDARARATSAAVGMGQAQQR
jgi:hypothetical protein